MAGIPPLRNIRKTTVILVAVLLAFLVHRTVAYLSTDDSIKDAGNTELSLAQGTVCRHIVKETPFGADSVFEEGSRLYFYTTISSALKDREDTLWHVWYHGMDTVQVLPCNLKKDSDTYNYIISPACAYTRLVFPLGRITDSIMSHMIGEINGEEDTLRRPYVNKAEVRIDVTNVYKGSESQKQRNDWLQPASYMLLIKESSMERFFANKELPSDTCALLSPLIQGKDATGESIYYYNYDLSDFITNQLRQDTHIDQLQMMLVPVSLNAVSGNAVTNYSSVRQQETMSVTQIESAKNGTDFEIVYSGFTLPVEH